MYTSAQSLKIRSIKMWLLKIHLLVNLLVVISKSNQPFELIDIVVQCKGIGDQWVIF